jgi:hypothetical protein
MWAGLRFNDMKRLNVLIAAARAAALVAAVMTFSATRAAAQAIAIGRAPFGQGEELVYNVSYRAALIPPINMMRITIRTFDETVAGQPHFHVVGNGRTSGAAKGLFELNDTYHVWLDAATLLPIRTTSDIREDSYRLTATYNYDWTAMSVSNIRRNPRWEAPRMATFDLPSRDCGDALSLFYRLRAVDVTRLVTGAANRLDLVLSEDAKPIFLRFVGRENVKVRKLGTFRALRFTCTMATSDGSTYEEGMSFTAWISDDENHIPLLVESPIRIGRVSVTLAEGFRTLKPLTSLIVEN